MERFYKEEIENSEQLSFNNIYSTNGGNYLELHSNRTAWKLNKEIEPFGYDYLVSEKAKQFKKETGVDVLLLGRSGRHVCVEINAETIDRYQELRKKALELEKEFVNEINNME